MNKREKAESLFLAGHNCAQAVFLAFDEEIGLPPETMRRLSAGLGGGVGGLRETCGVVTGMAQVLGMLEGSANPTDQAAKKALYARVQKVGQAFEEQCGSLSCRELLKLAKDAKPAAPLARNAEYYKARPCIRYVGAMAELLERALMEKA